MSQQDTYAYGTPLLSDPRHTHLAAWSRLPAAQQPSWEYHPDLGHIREQLTALPALVDQRDILTLRRLLSRVQAGKSHLLHIGECAETFAMADPPFVRRRLELYQRMAAHLAGRTGSEVVLLGRMAGQHAKPRSQPMEALANGEHVLTYRGDAVNQRAAGADARRVDPWRMLGSYHTSHGTVSHIQRDRHGRHPVFVSHEALLRDYEEPLTRGRDVLYATSGHLVWIGERTRRLWNWHLQWAKSIANPVAVKIGPTATPFDVFDVVRTLNPESEDGRLSLILRMGAQEAADRIGPVLRGVAESHSPVLWQCDPMHGNTRKLGESKVRLLPDLRAEITAFVRGLRRSGCHPGGLHLEVTPDDVRECHQSPAAAAGHRADPPCDPRLNPSQAMEIVDHFADEIVK